MQDLLLILIAPNVSEKMGGEGIKALQIFRELNTLCEDTIQITHGRNRQEVARLGLSNVEFIDDDFSSLLLWRTFVFRKLLDVWFSVRAVKLAERLAAERGGTRRVILHQTEPNSPVTPRALSSRYFNVFGPINGNIYYPPTFRSKETLRYRMRRVLHLPLQRVNRLLPGSLKGAQQILVAGGERTRISLRAAGCADAKLTKTIDCGIADALLDRPRVHHSGANLHFLHCGRLVLQKGTALIIESLAKTRLPVRLDIVGSGPELSNLTTLVTALRLEDRVRFSSWATQDELFGRFHNYRGLVLPSIEDSNGIVIQEAMALGLPPICLNWGGPGILIEHGVSGFLVEPDSRDEITSQIARHLDNLAENPDLAESVSISARRAAGAWRWSVLAKQWLQAYPT